VTWIRDNATTIVGWAAMLLSVAWMAGARVGALEDAHGDAQEEIAETRARVETHTKEIAGLTGDVRILQDQAERQEAVTTRQEQAVREMDRLVIHLQAIMEERQR